ncbi:MAG TPA: hypothetical protein VMN57_06915 [Anaerolineales bacterium]|nr:hypothetical protein [Anaerolineales bacterium]
MDDAQLFSYWYLWLGVAAVVVFIAAALLLAILITARSIETGAGIALDLVREIRDNTQVIWALEETNQTATDLLGGAEAILGNAGEIAQALHDADIQRERV